MPNGYQRIRNDIRYFRKAHFCPDCGSQLNKAEVSRVVNAGSPEARDFDFTMSPGIAMVGDVQFTWDEFECPECHRHFSVNEIKKKRGDPCAYPPIQNRQAHRERDRAAADPSVWFFEISMDRVEGFTRKSGRHHTMPAAFTYPCRERSTIRYSGIRIPAREYAAVCEAYAMRTLPLPGIGRSSILGLPLRFSCRGVGVGAGRRRISG